MFLKTIYVYLSRLNVITLGVQQQYGTSSEYSGLRIVPVLEGSNSENN
jgi:hypothetical protein